MCGHVHIGDAVEHAQGREVSRHANRHDQGRVAAHDGEIGADVAEVDHQDLWQRATLGVAAVSTSAGSDWMQSLWKSWTGSGGSGDAKP